MSDERPDTRFLTDLRARSAAGEMLKYLFFWSHRPGKFEPTAACLSQWYEAPFVVEGVRYPTAEQFMMAEKAALFGDARARERILGAPHPGAAKAIGREVRGFDETTWVAHRFAIVLRANQAKFAQHPELSRFLVQTGARILVEASPLDRVWGIGLAHDDVRAADPQRWPGLNLLGFALMRVRDGL